MLVNRSMAPGTVIPELGYPDVVAAADWLSGAFGFAVRLRIGDHRIQLSIGEGAMVATRLAGVDHPSQMPIRKGSSVMVRVEDADAHHARAAAHGARILNPPADYPYGERQYTALDPGGHIWTFSQSIDDVDPADWGGELS
jgi:uncharacterized glyoxalase superfamily protein PhnB